MQFSLKELGRPDREAILSSGTSLRRTATTWLRSLDSHFCVTHKPYKQQAACMNTVLAKNGTDTASYGVIGERELFKTWLVQQHMLNIHTPFTRL